MKITSLAENTSECGFPVEHGLSLYIEANGYKILFDSGQSGLFAENAERLGVDLSAVGLMVLSHGHYDHGGGLATFLSLNADAPVYLNRRAFEPHFRADGTYIGLDTMLQSDPRLRFTGGVCELGKGLTLYDAENVPVLRDLGSFGLNMEQHGKIVPDDFLHEQYLMIEENGKRVLISGCSHRGVYNIMSRFSPDVLVGGFHFSKLPPDDTLKAYALELAGFDTDYYTCHCTGTEQFGFMRRYMPRMRYLSTGQTITL